MQYLINLTGIWLVSLLVFDLFLKKESYHTYNRIYLLTTMLAGIIFPLIKWQPDTARFYTVVQKPVSNVIAMKGNIIAAAEPAAQVSCDQWLLMIYIVGVAVMVSLLLRDIVQLIGYYRAGRKSAIIGWTLVETGKGHAPFSFLNLLFVSSRADYSNDEWQMLVEHEGRHTRLLHVIDLVLLQLGRIIFWIHPLVYAYNKRLLMVHEYQADTVAAQNDSRVYGRFLAEQAILHGAPTITHSFNRSPIKKRILMLTKRSTTIAKGKMLVLLPLAFACILCFSQNSFSQQLANDAPVVILGSYSNLTNHASAADIIADPILRCTEANSEIVSFPASILCSDQEKDPYHGPFTVTGAKIPKQVIDLLKEHKGNKGRLFLEDIHVKIGGREVKANHIVLRYDH